MFEEWVKVCSKKNLFHVDSSKNHGIFKEKEKLLEIERYDLYEESMEEAVPKIKISFRIYDTNMKCIELENKEPPKYSGEFMANFDSDSKFDVEVQQMLF